MKKRKPPVVLATCLVIMLVAVAIVNRPQAADDGHGQTPEAPPPSAEQGERPKMTPQQISALSTKAAAPRPMPGGPTKLEGNGEPSVALPKQAPYKPTPNESSTSTQWYTTETGKK